ncbi:unnamed protein product [Sphenostylis stenocarpa]|uniref:Uncharacterized protein n=1 Tax=Sphenostylis stenocarpa TaxID=92480 RepID=A0AA86VFD0_9FABA|nr:unnamed protein product [Sphenostylis stenocarpa]
MYVTFPVFFLLLFSYKYRYHDRLVWRISENKFCNRTWTLWNTRLVFRNGIGAYSGKHVEPNCVYLVMDTIYHDQQSASVVWQKLGDHHPQILLPAS